MRYTPFTLIVCATLLSACSHTEMPTPQPTARVVRSSGNAAAEQVKQRQYLALPGQSAVRVGTADADAAFDRQVEAYAGGGTAIAPTETYPSSATIATADPSRVDIIPSPQPVTPTPAVVADPFPTPAPVTPTPDAVATPTVQPAGSSAPAATATPGSADYAVQITNGTTGRIFVEAQDAAGHIFPIGPMFGGQSINTPPDPIGPLQGPITVVIRDPDKDGAPEIRRYKVQPPAEYKGKTIGITILPGGQYRADVDKEVYYTSPAPGTQTAPAQGSQAPASAAQ